MQTFGDAVLQETWTERDLVPNQTAVATTTFNDQPARMECTRHPNPSGDA